jgi:ribose 1,5-bisphosphate isomerase
MEKIQDVADRIRTLEVKGARKVAISAVEALQVLALETKTKSRQEFLDELSEARETLFASRPTEPFMRNAVRFIMKEVEAVTRRKSMT